MFVCFTSAQASPPSPTDSRPSCPRCGGLMWDNRERKRHRTWPDYRCRDRRCGGVLWIEATKRAA